MTPFVFFIPFLIFIIGVIISDIQEIQDELTMDDVLSLKNQEEETQ